MRLLSKANNNNNQSHTSDDLDLDTLNAARHAPRLRMPTLRAGPQRRRGGQASASPLRIRASSTGLRGEKLVKAGDWNLGVYTKT